MNPKGLLAIALLIFVGACLVALAVNGFSRPGLDPQASARDSANASGPSEPASPGSPDGSLPGEASSGSPQQQITPAEPSSADSPCVQALYFHGNIRCPTCRKIEQYAHQAIHSAFAEELHSGKLTWQVINYEQPGNKSFVERYELVAPTLVLVRMDGDREVEYENLMEVWQLVGDQPAFFKFVQDHVRAMLGAAEE